MALINTYGGNPYNGYNVANSGLARQNWNPQPQSTTNGIYYVHGIEGAYAFTMPPNVMRVVLWDDEVDSFYIKEYDQNGIPRIIAWNDYHPHAAEKQQEPKQIDMSMYPTKDDIKEMINSIDTSKFVTKDDIDQIISELSVADKGRIVRGNG